MLTRNAGPRSHESADPVETTTRWSPGGISAGRGEPAPWVDPNIQAARLTGVHRAMKRLECNASGRVLRATTAQASPEESRRAGRLNRWKSRLTSNMWSS
jgi:hypothetical protein